MTGEGVTLWTWKWFGFFKYLHYMYDTGERSEPEKIIKIRKKTTFGPPLLPIKPPHKTPPLTNLRGGGGEGVRTPGPPSGSAHVINTEIN